MNKNLKETFSVIIVILGIIISMPTIVTMADTTLHTWGKTLTRGVWESVNDDGISKNTTSSVYLSYTGGSSYSSTMNATVYSCHTENGTNERINYNGKWTPIYTLRYGDEIYMVNYVGETGRKYIKVCGLAGNTETYSGKLKADLY